MIVFRSQDRPFCLDRYAGQLWAGRERTGEPIHLPPKQRDLLRYLAENPGRLIPKQELVANVWGSVPDGVTDDAISRAISGIRRALGDVDPDHPCFIQTAHGRGFRFVAEIERVEPPDGPLQPTNGNPNEGTSRSVDGRNKIATASKRDAAKPPTNTQPVKIAEWTRILRSKNGVDDFAKHISGPEDVSAIDSLINESLP